MTSSPSDYLPELVEQTASVDGPPAWEQLQRAAREHPQDARPLALLGASLMASGEVDAAEGAYLSALQRAPGFAIARFQLGLLQLTSGRPAAAAASWAPLEALGEADPLCLFKRGLEALTRGRLDEARALLQAGIAANTELAPLNDDMQGVLDRLAERGLVPGAPPSSGAEDRAPAPENHFLLSSYERKV